MEVEIISENNISYLVQLVLKLWPECKFDEELENYRKIIDSENEVCYLAKVPDNYVAFIHLALRSDYVEGAAWSPVGYLEGLFVKPEYQKKRIGAGLLRVGEDWARKKGCRQIASDTELHNSAGIEFHKRTGFEEVNRVVCFIKEISDNTNVVVRD